MKSDLSISTPGMLLTPGIFYSSKGRIARVSNGNTGVVIGNPPNSSLHAIRINWTISTVDRLDLANPDV